ncbi:indole-3-glycerol phosphate synthase-domain-containing protein [Pisolithus marmoratus]|nr:indole-3-glycerol phosphate synthase-domain-containing protein [Pisolithus marmoratus]
MTLPPELAKPIDCLMIDNFDSFTWNLYQQLCLLGADVTVIRNDAIPSSALSELNIRVLIISPGPGHPHTDSGISRDAIRYFAGKVPVLGVCMGLECVVDVYGGEIGYAGEIKHGKLSPIRHDERGIFRGIPQSILSTRYHSLSASLSTLPPELMVTCATEESGVIMGVRHRTFALEAVQYHPESILSQSGDTLLRNFLALRGGTWTENPESCVLDPPLPPFPFEAFEGKVDDTPVTRAKVSSILGKIYAQRTQDVARAKLTPGTSASDLSALLAMHVAPPLVALVPRLRARRPALMAEIKRASPSKGDIAPSANAALQARTYALAGASVISVLTEPTWFKGSLLDMRLARQAIDNLPHRPAILRKDFILDEYQISEARLYGADTVLLIVAMLAPERLKELYAYSLSLGMEPLVEVNNAQEMTLALELGAKVIGVNNRNLHNFAVDMGTTSRLADMVKERDVILCALSGISSTKDVKQYAEQGVAAVLVGEALMRAKDTKAFIHELLDWPAQDASNEPRVPLVKICGVRDVDEAKAVAHAGADLIGVVFASASKRRVSIDVARDIAKAVRTLRFGATAKGKDEDEPAAQPNGQEQSFTDVNESWFTGHARRLSVSADRPLLVGVFQNHTLEEILSIVSSVQLDLVQLHGKEPLEWSKHIPVPVIRAFHVSTDGSGLEDLTRPGMHQFVLLDSQRPSDGLSGGSGKLVDWNLAADVVKKGEISNPSEPAANGETQQDGVSESASSSDGETSGSKCGMPIILAGGLTPENVASAVESVRPWAVDVSGGVETSDGKHKDLSKVSAFIQAVKEVHLL